MTQFGAAGRGETQGPGILELLSELEQRDEASKGQSESEAGAALADPRGYSVFNPTGHDVGKVEDLYVDPHTREPRFALLRLGRHPLGIGDRHVLVDFSDLEIDSQREVRVRAAL
jgi:sporulation protein YlmC with PRC-barrel domain